MWHDLRSELEGEIKIGRLDFFYLNPSKLLTLLLNMNHLLNELILNKCSSE